MLGRSHAILGSTVILGIDGYVNHAILHNSISPSELAAALAIGAGFSLLPDIDEPGATLSRKLGAISKGLSTVVNVASGGHRHGTHSLLFVLLTYVGFAYLDRFALTGPIAIYASLATVLVMVVPFRIVRQGSFIAMTVPIVAALLLWHVETGSFFANPAHVQSFHHLTWLPVAAASGVAAHLLGDIITTQGVPLLWPLQKRTFAIPLIGKVHSIREHILDGVLFLALGYFMWIFILYPMVTQAKIS